MKIDKLQKIIDILLQYGLIIISILLAIIGVLSIFITGYFETSINIQSEKTLFKYSFGIIELLASIAFIIFTGFITHKLLKKVPSKFLLIPIAIGSMGIYFYWIKAIHLPPIEDQKLIHEMAIGVLNNNINNYNAVSQYLFLYPYQFGLTLLVAGIYKIFGENYLYIQYLNVICSITNMFIIFYISKLIFNNENVQKILVILLGGFSLYWMFFNVHFYGNIIGLTFALLAVLFTILYLNKNKKIYLLFSGILISLSILMKTNYQIFLCGIILVLLLKIIKEYNLKTLLIIPIFLIGYLGINIGYSSFVKHICNVKLSDGMPYISFVYMGMAEPESRSPGWYTDDTAKIYRESNYNNEQAIKKSKELIKERLEFFFNNPNIFIDYYLQKIGSTWLNPTFQTIWCSTPGARYNWYPEYAEYLGYHETSLSMVAGNLYKLEENYFNIYQIIIFIFASIACFKISNKSDIKKVLIPIIFIGGFLFHIIWETKSIYVIQYYFILLPFASYALNLLFEKIGEKLNSRKSSI